MFPKTQKCSFKWLNPRAPQPESLSHCHLCNTRGNRDSSIIIQLQRCSVCVSLLRQWLSCEWFNPTRPITATNEACHVGQIYSCWSHSVEWLRRLLCKVVICNTWVLGRQMVELQKYNNIIRSWEPHTSVLNWVHTLLQMIQSACASTWEEFIICGTSRQLPLPFLSFQMLEAIAY